MRKLSRPWHGPYRVLTLDDPDITVVKVYYPQDGQIQIHQSRVKPCPDFPAGFHWYGSHRRGPGRPPKWVDKDLKGSARTTSPHPAVSQDQVATGKRSTSTTSPHSLPTQTRYNLRSHRPVSR